MARQWRILISIEASGQGLTVAEIANNEGIGVRTAYRDLEALQAAGFPLYCERVERVNRWAFVDTYKFQVPQPFTMTELMSLHLYADLIRMFKGTTFYDSLESLFKKVRSTLPPSALNYLDKIQSTFSIGIKPYKEYGRFKKMLNQINQAVTDNVSLEIAYLPLRTDKEVLRKVNPYRIWFFEGTIYLIAHCQLRNDVRMFVIDRIKMLRVTGDSFTVPKDFSLDEFLKYSFKVIQDEMHTVKIRISPKWARWAGEKIWHESQKAEKLKDGSLELTFQVAGLDEIRMWVLSLGPEAVVIEPDALKQAVTAGLHEALSQYEAQALVDAPESVKTKVHR